MLMARRGWFLRIAKGTGLAVLLCIAFGVVLFLRGPMCWTCGATGRIRSVECTDCEGTGATRELSISVRRMIGCGRGPSEPLRLVVSRNGDSIFECDPNLVPVCFWFAMGLFVAGALVVGLRADVCPLCRGEGRLVLEVISPDGRTRIGEVPCPACEGWGALTSLDRWIAGL
jgi:DnaJ-class molecular chaperone